MNLSRRQRWWVGIAILAVCVVVMGYALLPWWLPGEFVRGMVIDGLERELGRKVSVGEVKFSWVDGIEIRDVVIGRREGFGTGELLQIKRVSLALAPVRLALGKVDYLNVEGVDAYLVAAAGGKINIADLLESENEQGRVKLSQMRLAEVRCHLLSEVAGEFEESLLEIEELNFLRGPGGDVRFVLRGRQGDDAESTFMADGRIGLSGSDDEAAAEGQYGRLTVRELDLGELKLKHWLRLIRTGGEGPGLIRLDELEGTCSLDIGLSMTDEGMLGIKGWFEMAGLTAGADEQTLVQDVRVRGDLEMRVDPVAGVYAADRLEIVVFGEGDEERPALEVVLEVGYDPRPGADDTLTIAAREGRCDPAAILALAPVLAESDFMLNQAVESEGTISFTAGFRSNEREDIIKLRIDGTHWQVRTMAISKERGAPAVVEVMSQFNRRSGLLCLDPLRVEWMSLVGTGKIIVPDRYKLDAVEELEDYAKQLWQMAAVLVKQRRSLGVDLVVEIGDFGDMEQSVEHILDGVRGLELSGPVGMELHIGAAAEQVDQKRKVSLAVRLGDESQCTLEVYSQDRGEVVFKKDKGDAFSVVLDGSVDVESPRWDGLLVEARLGDEGKLAFGPGRMMWPAAGEPNGVVMLVGEWEIEGIEQWLEVLPSVRRVLKRKGAVVAGGCQGSVSLERDAGRDWSVAGEAELTKFGFELRADGTSSAGGDPVAHKAIGEPMRAELTALTSDAGRRLEYAVEANLGQGWLGIKGTAALGSQGLLGQVRLEKLMVDARSDALERLGEYLPGLFDEAGMLIVGPYCLGQLSGGVTLQAEVQVSESGAIAKFEVNGTDAGFVLSKEQDGAAAGLGGILAPQTPFVWEKKRGVRLDASGELDLSKSLRMVNWLLLRGNGAIAPIMVEVKKFRVQMEDSWLEVNGDLIVNERAQLRGWGHWLEVLQEGTLDWKGQVDYGDLSNSSAALMLGGTARMVGQMSWDQEQDRLECRLDLDMTDTAVQGRLARLGSEGVELRLDKPRGDELRVSLRVVGGMKKPDVRLEELELVCLGGVLRCQGKLEEASLGSFIKGTASGPGRALELGVDLDVPALAALGNWIPQLKRWGLAGWAALQAEVAVQFEPQTVMYLQGAQVDLLAQVVLADVPLRLRVSGAEISSRRVLVPAVDIQVGGSGVTIVADVRDPGLGYGGGNWIGARPEGRIDLVARRVDIDELQEIAVAVAQEIGLARGPGMDGLSGDPNVVVNLLRRTRLWGSARIGQLSYTDVDFRARMELEECRLAYHLDEDGVMVEFRAGLSGGVLNGKLECDLGAGEPMVVQEIDMREAAAGESLRRMVEGQFPGMEVNGVISEKKRLSMPLTELLAGGTGWVGEGTTVCTDGVLYGPAGPKWMLRAFPGLQLVEYPWKQTTNQYSVLADGRTKNHMLFKGDKYDIYLDGVSVGVEEPNGYAAAMVALENDLDISRERVRRLDAGDSKMTVGMERWVRRRDQGLAALWRRHGDGEVLRVTAANYVVGGLVSTGGKGVFAKPRELLRAPLFRSRSFIIEQFMVGIDTRNVTLADIGRESLIYRLIKE